MAPIIYQEIDRIALQYLLKYSIPLFKRKKDEEQQSELEELAKSDTKVKEEALKSLVYLDKYQQERLSDVYTLAISAYLDRRIEALQDFTDRVPGKHLDSKPKSVMGGILGFTYEGDNRATRRDDLTGSIAEMVDIHECIHTPNEYETRLLTAWIMAKEIPKYIK